MYVGKFVQISAMLKVPTGALMSSNVEPAVTVNDVVRFLNVEEKTICRLVTKGELPAFKVLVSWRFRRCGLVDWVELKNRRQRWSQRTARASFDGWTITKKSV